MRVDHCMGRFLHCTKAMLESLWAVRQNQARERRTMPLAPGSEESAWKDEW